MQLKSKEEKKMLKRSASLIVAFALVLTLFAGIGVYAVAPQPDLTAKNVILLIGSGISPAHVNAARIKSGRQLNLLNLTYSGTLDTTNSDNAISDPAAAATALSTGKKTLNFNLGIDHEGNPATLITEALQSAGKKIGIITDKYLNDATPAAFAVHNPLKSDLYGVARQEIASGFDLFLGGGSKYFDNYRAEMKAAGYEYVTSPGRLSELTPDKKIIGAFSNYSFDTGYQVPSLSAMLTKATELLGNPDGFFIVAEGGLIDKYCFERNMNKMVEEFVKFDEAVGVAMAYVDEHPDTLLVVAGDVEAGQLTLNDRPNQGNTTNSCFKKYGTSSLNTALYTYGKNASALTGEHKSIDVPKFISASMGVYDFAQGAEQTSAVNDYTVDELNSFSSWSFTNIKKNSHVNGITLNTTSSNNSAVTAMVSKGSLVVMANARVGFDLTVTTPLASPFKLKNGGSTDLSAYDGFVLSASGLEDNTFTLTVGKGSTFTASADFSEAMKNEYGEILLPFDSFEPAIAAENAVGLDTFGLSTTGCSAKSTVKLDSIHAYKTDTGISYAELLGIAYGKDSFEYTSASFAAFSSSFEAFKSAVTREERYAAKLDLISKIDALVPIPLSSEAFGLVEANKDSLGVSCAAASVSDGMLDTFCGNADTRLATKSVEISRSWTQYTVNFNSRNYTKVYLSFTSGNSPDGSSLLIDDLAVTPAPAAGEVLVKNGDFEDAAVDPWIIYNDSFITNDAHGGSRALRLMAAAKNAKTAKQTGITVSPNTDYTLTFWAKGENDNTGTKPYIGYVYGDSANASVMFENIPEVSGNYGAIRFRLASLHPDFTNDDFAVRMTVATADGETAAMIERALISEGNYCFALPAAPSEIVSIKVEFINAAIGAVVRIEGVDLLSNAPVKSANSHVPSALSILRAAAGLAVVDNADLNGDGRVDVADALLALRAECAL